MENRKEPRLISPELDRYVAVLIDDFINIPGERKDVLSGISEYISGKAAMDKLASLVFICTHNSRRSQISQIWATLAAYYYDVENIDCFSGGTEATAFNTRAVAAMQRAGFSIVSDGKASNPNYKVGFAKGAIDILSFSKKYNDPFNPDKDFAAIMTCTDADKNCPVVFGSEKRFSLPYEDPKMADDTRSETSAYDERCRQIGTEMFYMLSLL